MSSSLFWLTYLAREKWLDKRRLLKAEVTNDPPKNTVVAQSDELKKRTKSPETPVKRTEVTGANEPTTESYDSSVIEKANKSFEQNRFSEVVDTFLKYQKSERYVNDVTEHHLKQIAGSLLLVVGSVGNFRIEYFVISRCFC